MLFSGNGCLLRGLVITKPYGAHPWCDGVGLSVAVHVHNNCATIIERAQIRLFIVLAIGERRSASERFKPLNCLLARISGILRSPPSRLPEISSRSLNQRVVCQLSGKLIKDRPTPKDKNEEKNTDRMSSPHIQKRFRANRLPTANCQLPTANCSLLLLFFDVTLAVALDPAFEIMRRGFQFIGVEKPTPQSFEEGARANVIGELLVRLVRCAFG